MCVRVCVRMRFFYLRLCVDVGIVSDELFDHVLLSRERCYVEGSVPFLLPSGEKKMESELFQ